MLSALLEAGGALQTRQSVPPGAKLLAGVKANEEREACVMFC